MRYLVNPFKHGFAPELAERFHLQHVTMSGTLIAREDQEMIEVLCGGISGRLGHLTGDGRRRSQEGECVERFFDRAGGGGDLFCVAAVDPAGGGDSDMTERCVCRPGRGGGCGNRGEGGGEGGGEE